MSYPYEDIDHAPSEDLQGQPGSQPGGDVAAPPAVIGRHRGAAATMDALQGRVADPAATPPRRVDALQGRVGDPAVTPRRSILANRQPRPPMAALLHPHSHQAPAGSQAMYQDMSQPMMAPSPSYWNGGIPQDTMPVGQSMHGGGGYAGMHPMGSTFAGIQLVGIGMDENLQAVVANCGPNAGLLYKFGRESDDDRKLIYDSVLKGHRGADKTVSNLEHVVLATEANVNKLRIKAAELQQEKANKIFELDQRIKGCTVITDMYDRASNFTFDMNQIINVQPPTDPAKLTTDYVVWLRRLYDPRDDHPSKIAKVHGFKCAADVLNHMRDKRVGLAILASLSLGGYKDNRNFGPHMERLQEMGYFQEKDFPIDKVLYNSKFNRPTVLWLIVIYLEIEGYQGIPGFERKYRDGEAPICQGIYKKTVAAIDSNDVGLVSDPTAVAHAGASGGVNLKAAPLSGKKALDAAAARERCAGDSDDNDEPPPKKRKSIKDREE